MKAEYPREVAVLDIETTGLDPKKEGIIEVGAALFSRNEEEGGYKLSAEYQSLNDPGIPIPTQIQQLTGLKDRDVKGKKFDVQRLWEIIGFSNITIAHNASFEISFLKSHFEGVNFEKISWGCSLKMVDWRGYNFGCGKLQHVAADLEICRHELGAKLSESLSPHRALYDAWLLWEVLQREPPNVSASHSFFWDLLRAKAEGMANVVLYNTPFERKEEIKADGYWWNPNGKTWVKILRKDLAKAEASKKRDSGFQVRLVKAEDF